MLEKDTITIGNSVPKHDTLIINISQMYTIIAEDGVVGINLNREENENRILEEINALMLQEDMLLNADNINKIEELINKLPIDEKRIELVYRKDELLKSIKVQKLIHELENNIGVKNSIEKIVDIISLMSKYEEINKIRRNCSLEELENKLLNIHKDKFEQLLNKENCTLESLDKNIEKYEELKNNIEKLQKNVKYVSSNSLKDVIINQINILSDKKDNIGSKLMESLNCDESSLEQAIKSQKLINIINNGDSSEEIDNLLIENNFIDYINLGQKKRKRALSMFIESKNNNYTTIEKISKDLDIIVSELKKQLGLSNTIRL